MRSYLAPLGIAVAERLDVGWTTLDLDEDDTVLASPEEAAAYDRLLATFGPLYDGLSAASGVEADAVGRRHGLEITHLPNAVDIPAAPVRPAGQTSSLLFVGNMTYPPNLQAARTLVANILPALRFPARLVLVGPNDRRLETLAGAQVEVTGFVADIADVYATAGVAIIPLQTGAGTRLKILEAFAHRVPVVATPVAAAGLECEPGRHLLVAEDTAGLAAAVDRLLADDALARQLADAAYDLVLQRYSTDVVIPTIRDFFARAAGRRQPD
jgi:glycosyltransferase involved in cell wall biosynthesis